MDKRANQRKMWPKDVKEADLMPDNGILAATGNEKFKKIEKNCRITLFLAVYTRILFIYRI